MESDIIKMVKHLPRVVGLRQVLKGLKNGTLRCVVIARDCEDFVSREVDSENQEHCIPVYVQGTMKELGMICGIDVGTAVVGIKNE